MCISDRSVNGPLAILNEYYGVYVTQPEDAKWRLDNMHETYLQDMNSKYVYPNVFMSIDDTNKVSQYDTDIKKYAEQKKADWILNGGIDEEMCIRDRMIGPNVTLATPMHPFLPEERNSRKREDGSFYNLE